MQVREGVRWQGGRAQRGGAIIPSREAGNRCWDGGLGGGGVGGEIVVEDLHWAGARGRGVWSCISSAAHHLLSGLMCDVDERLGTHGVQVKGVVNYCNIRNLRTVISAIQSAVSVV